MAGSETQVSIRKGAKTMAEIPPEILQALEIGSLPTANLVESLAVNQANLAVNLLKQLHQKTDAQNIRALHQAQNLGFLQRCRTISGILERIMGPEVPVQMCLHTSDLVRCWALLWTPKNPNSVKEELLRLRPFADDAHFAVREMAWLALRPLSIEKTTELIEALLPWTQEESDNLRRFACEATRPRGVWCAHIPRLKAKPELAQDLLDHLCNDPALYVQNSVGNWLNDAGKSRPDFVFSCRDRWIRSPMPTATGYILKRGLRGLQK
jgi:3-methyladenine DNA glycosylase AlkC